MLAHPPPPRSLASQRILHVFRAPVGGLFRHVLDLARYQIEQGHAVGLVCDAITGAERAERQLADLAPHLELGLARIPMRRNPSPSDLAALRGVSRIAARTDASVLHGHGAKGGVYARLARIHRKGGRAHPAPIRVYTPHGGSYHYPPGTLLHRLFIGTERALARRTDLFLFESAYTAGLHQAYVGGAGLTRVVHNGLSPAEFEPVVPDAAPFDLLYLGELRALKGVAYLLDALAELRAAGRPLRLLVIGAGPDEAAFRQRADALGLADAVRFEPPQPIRAALPRARAMVMPSLAESLPYVVLETVAARQPLVCTNVGGIPEIFGPETAATAPTGLVPPRAVPALARAILATLDEDPAKRDLRLAARAAAVEARFALPVMGADVLAGYAMAQARTCAAAARSHAPGKPGSASAAPLSVP